MFNVSVIGCGYWGPNLIRNFGEIDEANMVICCDLNQDRLNLIAKKYPSIETTTDFDKIISDDQIDAVAIATPISTHFRLAKKALESGKHVLLEKPMTTTVNEAGELIELAERNELTLMVDHTFIYTGAVRKIKEIIDSGEIGDIHYLDSVRVNLGLFQHDVNVLWDLGPHDFSIMDHLIDEEPTSIQAAGACHIDYSEKPIESVVYVTVNFENNIIAHFHLNWFSPVKVRRTLIGGSRKMIVYDHLDPDNQVKVYDKGVELTTKEDIYKTLIQYRTGDMYAPKIDQTEALETECKHFLDCVKKNEKPVTDGYKGLRVVEFLEKTQESIKRHKEIQV